MQVLIDDAFLMDTDVGIEIESNEDRFENYSTPLDDIDPCSIFWRQDNLSPSLDINPIQVFYVVLSLHCMRCAILPGCCSFPGCPQYKTNRCFEVHSEYGSGRHILEKTIRSYLMNAADKELRSKFLNTKQRPDMGPDPDESDEEDRLAAEKEEEDCIEEGVGETKWKKLKVEAAEYRYLNRRIARTEFEKFSSKTAYLAAQTGDYPLDEDQNISIERKQSLEGLLDHMTEKSSKSFGKPAVEDPTVDKEGFTRLIDIPLSVMKWFTGKFPDSLFGISTSDIDPYPANLKSLDKNDCSEVYPMKTNLFCWIMNRFSIQQTLSSDSNVLIGDLNFDRLQGQRVIDVDGVLIIVQVLFGILPGALATGPIDGFPISAKRYHDASLLSEFEFGLTISVYDTLSNFSRALQFGESTIDIWSEQLGLHDVEIPLLSTEILRRAHEIISVYRAGKMFIAFFVQPKKVVRVAKTLKPQKTASRIRSPKEVIERRQRPSYNFRSLKILDMIRESENYDS